MLYNDYVNGYMTGIRSLLDLAFSWLLSKPHIPSVIAGATSADQVFANSRAAGWKLSESDLNEIEDIVSTANS